jgi:hypothetical protein
MINTISTIVENTVDLGVGNYASALTITSTGGVEPTAYSSIGVSSAVSGASLNNAGVVIGGAGAYPTDEAGGTGGIGVDFTASVRSPTPAASRVVPVVDIPWALLAVPEVSGSI